MTGLNRLYKLNAGPKKGTRIGGRPKGTLNKRTIEKLNEVSRRVRDRRRGRKREVVGSVAVTAVSAAASYQQPVLAAGDAATAEGSGAILAGDEVRWGLRKSASAVSEPDLKAIAVTVEPDDQAAPPPANDQGAGSGGPGGVAEVYHQVVRPVVDNPQRK